MKKILISVLMLSLFLTFFGCDQIDDSRLAATVMTPTPGNEPRTPVDDSGGSYSGGDSGGGSLSSGSYSGGGSSPTANSSLPDATKGKATTSSAGIEILEGQNLPLTDENLKKAVDTAQNQLKNDKKFSKFSILCVTANQKLSNGDVKIKLNTTYKNKVAYVYFLDTNGTIVKINKNSDKDYISYTLDDKLFAENELTLNFGNQTGTFLCVFGAN